jgi:hypothetical protein
VPVSRFLPNGPWRVPPALAYDGGMGVGAAGFGVLAARTGYPVAFALTAAVLPATPALITLGNQSRYRT